MVWVNDDGLRVKFGTEEATPARVTEITNGDNLRTVEVVLDADFLPAGGTIFFDEYVFPEGGQIEAWETVAPSEDFAGGTSIAADLVDRDGTSNSVTVTGAVAIADLNAAGERTTLDTTILTDQKYLRLTTVGTFTTGKSVFRIDISIPKDETDTLVWDKSA